MHNQFENIPFHSIQDSGFYSLHPFRERSAIDCSLSASFQSCGILTPPTLIKTKDSNKFDVVCGRQRLQFAQTTQDSMICRVLPYDSKAEPLLSLLLEDQHNHSPLGAIEQACFLGLCEKLLSDQKQCSLYLQSLPPGRITKGSKFLKALLNLPPTAQKAMHTGLLSEKAASHYLNLNQQDGETFLHLLEAIPIRPNKQKKVLSELVDILKRERILLASFLEDPEVDRILNSQEMNSPQKCDKFLQYVHSRWRPLLHQAQKAFDHEVRNMGAPDFCTITPSPFFERDEIFLTVRFPDLKSMRSNWPEILASLERWMT